MLTNYIITSNLYYAKLASFLNDAGAIDEGNFTPVGSI
jgi:hypothetical protein